MSKKGDSIFIEHMLESINAIEDFSKGLTKKEFISSRLKQSAIVREIDIIGEAVKNISSGLKEKYKKIAWRDIAGTRDKMIHHYFGVDLEIVLGIIQNDLPVLKKQILRIKKDLGSFGKSIK